MEPSRSLTVRPWRVAAVFLPGLIVGLYFILSTDPMPQPLSYHDFADDRVLLGIPHAGDVLTNLAFIIVGTWGLWLVAQPDRTTHAFIDKRERWLFQWFFAGVFLTGFGSGWFHLAPDNDSLVWDRLPMAISFMSIVAIMLAERVKLSLGVGLLIPLVVIGVGTVIWWIWTEHARHGDLRPYYIVQFYPMITIALMLFLLPSPYTRSSYYWGLFVFYAAAKATELLDHQIYGLTHGVASGHNLKHLFAAAGAAWIIRMVWLRQPCQPV
ncbi:MAG: hypothetical protein PVH25_13845 [Burkholderiales bacterium]|jgi:hypothetical protein